MTEYKLDILMKIMTNKSIILIKINFFLLFQFSSKSKLQPTIKYIKLQVYQTKCHLCNSWNYYFNQDKNIIKKIYIYTSNCHGLKKNV